MNAITDAANTFQLTDSQRSVLTGQHMQPGQPLYNMCMCFNIDGKIEYQAFNNAFQTLVNHCDSLRTVIVEHENETVTQARQRVLAQFEYSVAMYDFSSEPDPKVSAGDWIEQHKLVSFERHQCLFESALLKLSDNAFIWYLNQHHLLTDAWSMSVLFKHMQSFYRSSLDQIPLQHIDIPDFKAYAEQEKLKAQTKRCKAARLHWKNCADTPFHSSDFYRPNRRDKSARTHRVNCGFGLTRSNRVKALAKGQFLSFSEDLSVMQIFSSLLFAFLHRVGGEDHLSIGTPVHSRTSQQLRETTGLLISVFPLQIDLSVQETFESLYNKVAKSNQQVLINAVPGSGDMKLARKFDVVLNYIPSAFGSFCDMPVKTDWMHCDYGDRDHVMRMQVHDLDDTGEFTVCFDLNEDVFSPKEREWVCEHFLILTDALLASPGESISVPALLNNTLLPYQASNEPQVCSNLSNVISLIAHQTGLSQQDSALADNQQSLSYSDLHTLSNQFAHYLVLQGIGKGDVVALRVGRSIHAVVAIIGILKIGATFLPFDTAHPDERISFMLQDSNTKLLLIEGENHTGATAQHGKPTFHIVDQWSQISSMSSLPIELKTNPDDIAYIIYTSGSTGQPKGVLVPHKGFSNYLLWAKKYYLQGQKLDFALFSSLSFDLTITSLFVPLIAGSKVVIYPQKTTESEITIRAVIEDNRVDIIKLTPSHLTLIQSMDFSSSRLKKLIVGGEDFKTELASNMHRFFAGQIALFNEYGPTEATVACTVHQFNPESDDQSSVPIGRPISNTNIYIFDAYFNLVPQGVEGELFISGIGLAKGYLNQPEMTKGKFVQNPHQPEELLYRSGDRARFNHRGEIEYLGRSDQQVKVHGVRLETSEIESALLKYDSISAAVVDLSVHLAQQNHDEQSLHCVDCGIEANHPSAQIDESGVCRLCHLYHQQEAEAQGYFKRHEDLVEKIAEIKCSATSKQDSIMLLSGGKDSSYALCKLVDMGLTPLVFMLDNGFISDGAKANVNRLVDKLGLELHVAETPAMNDIFVDSLTRFSNVCNGCFKTIYTLSTKLARERGIKVICTGLSRGQIFETRVAHLFQQGCFDTQEIDQRIIEARKAYHRTKDIIATKLDVKVFEDDSVFEDVQYLDYYRYEDVTLDTMYDYLNNIAPWIRPSDTGRSTNCLINDAGIYVHKRERGYHNYSLPYSWDVRLGHKKRDAALEELDDEIDQQKVDTILDEIGYQSEDEYCNLIRQDSLIGYYVAPSEILKNTLQKHLAKTLPAEYIPSQFVWMSALPVTANGKVDRQALPRPRGSRRELTVDYAPPRKTSEKVIASLWQQILGVEEVGIDDNFFDLGGDSIVNIQIVAAAREKNIVLTPQQIFDYPTIRALAKVSKDAINAKNSVQDDAPMSEKNHLVPPPAIDQQDLDDIYAEFGED